MRSRGAILALVVAALLGSAVVPASGVAALSAVERAHLASHGTWARVGPMPHRRANQVMVRLADGRVLVAGGSTSNDATSKRSADIFDPRTNRWSPASPMHRARSSASSVLLPGGGVLVVGGSGTIIRHGDLFNVFLRSAEVYHPAIDRWTRVSPMHDRRLAPVIELLSNGQVLVAGGYNDRRGATSSELFRPRTGRWRMTDSMSVPRYLGASAVLPNGDILAAGGRRDPVTRRRTAERYVVGRQEWRPAGQLLGAAHPRLFRLANDSVLAIAGEGHWYSPTRQVARYALADRAWHQVASLPTARASMSVVSLRGHPLVLGGSGPAARYTTATGFLWRPARQRWVLWTRMPQPLSNLSAVRLRDGSILVAGGQSKIYEGSHVPTKCAFRYFPRGVVAEDG